MRYDLPAILLVGWINILGESSADHVLGPVTQVGALGLLGMYLLWQMRERAAERRTRQEDDRAEREARLAEIKAIADAHTVHLRETIQALSRAYERTGGDEK